MRNVLHRLLPSELQVPTHLPQLILTKTGYFRLRTLAAARGNPVPDSHLYQPLFSPWQGEPAFERLYRQIRSHTLVSRDRAYMLWRTLQQSLHLAGDVIECGVFRGGTALLEAQTIAAQGGDRSLHLFDSFQGMPQTTAGVDRIQEGDFSTTSVEDVARLFEDYPFVKIHQGFIPQTFEGLTIDSIAWAHIDVDIYQSVLDCINYTYPRLVPGGVMIFDDYGFPCCAGARRAVDEAFSGLPEVPLCLPTGQCLVTKLPSR
jgi:O-methyltransferase